MSLNFDRAVRKAQERLGALQNEAFDLLKVESRSEEQSDRLDVCIDEIRDCKRTLEAAEAAAPGPTAPAAAADDGEAAEMRQLREKVSIGRYMEAAYEGRGVDGAERELNQHHKLPGNKFPLEILAPETRATTDADATANQQAWIDRLFSETAAMGVGVTFKSVAPGVAAIPVTTAGASAAQRGRTEPASDATWTVGVTEIKPTRNAVRGVYTSEDAMRLPGLEAALRRDLRMALTEGVDRAVFLGDAGANENGADIAGLTTATGVTEVEINQGNKTKGPETLKVFLDRVDGKHATSTMQLGIVSTVGANTLWGSTLIDTAADSTTVAQFLREAGLSWTVRGDIETGTADGDFGAFIGGMRNIMGAGCAAVWNAGELIRDPYTKAATGEVAITLSYQWGLAFPRASHFARVKFVT